MPDYRYFIYMTEMDDGDEVFTQSVNMGYPDAESTCATLRTWGWREIHKVLFDRIAEFGLETIDEEDWK